MALYSEACFGAETGRARSGAFTGAEILDAQKQLILRRETLLDQLADKLQEDPGTASGRAAPPLAPPNNVGDGE